MSKLSYQAFSEVLKSQFELPLNHPDFPEPIILTLAEVNHLGNRTEQDLKGQPHLNTLREETFNIVFKGPHTPVLNQGAYTMNHPVLGTIESLFIVPVDEDSAGVSYEAVFN